MKPVLEWTDTGYCGHDADIGEMIYLAVSPCEVRQEWDWRVDTYDGRLIGEGTDDGRGPDAAKLAAEAFARQWIAKQAAALGDGWISVEERLPEDGETVLAAGFKAGSNVKYQHVAFRDTAGHWKSDDRRSIIGVTHWRPLPALPTKETHGD